MSPEPGELLRRGAQRLGAPVETYSRRAYPEQAPCIVGKATLYLGGFEAAGLTTGGTCLKVYR